MTPTQSVDGHEHPASDFAYVPDPEKSPTWKLPIFDADHVRNALARFDQTELPEGVRAEVLARIHAAAHKFGIDVGGKSADASGDYGYKALQDVTMSDEGKVRAVVATFDTVDNDGEVILGGAIPDGMKCTASYFNHDTVMNHLNGMGTPDAPPVAKGVIRIEGSKAVAHLDYFMETQRGREAYLTVKAMGKDQPWSFAYRKESVAKPDAEWSAKGARLILTKLGPLLDGAMEVSPVKMPGGKNTGTLSAKSATPTASVDGTEHPASDFAYVPDHQNPSTWKFPIFNASHVRNALARFDQADLPDTAKAEVRNRILEAARKFGIDVSKKSAEPLFSTTVRRVMNRKR